HMLTHTHARTHAHTHTHTHTHTLTHTHSHIHTHTHTHTHTPTHTPRSQSDLVPLPLLVQQDDDQLRVHLVAVLTERQVPSLESHIHQIPRGRGRERER